MAKRKLTLASYKRILPDELYENRKEAKRGQGDMMQIVTTRLNKDEYSELMELLTKIKCKRSNFIRHAIQSYKQQVEQIIEKAENEER